MGDILKSMAGTSGGAAGWGSSPGGRPGPDGHHDDLLPEDLDGLTLHAPDDPRELEDDREQWLREEGEEQHTGSPGPPFIGVFGSATERRKARQRRLAVTAAIVLVSMVVVAVSGVIGAWIVGPHAAPPPAAALSTSGPDPGHVGGLLPETTLADGGTPISARSLRPAVIALVPSACSDCSDLLQNLSTQVEPFGVSLVAVGETSQADELDSYVTQLGTTHLSALTDPQGALRDAYSADGTTLLLVRADGVVTEVMPSPSPTVHLERSLVDLVPGVGLGT
jgi:hypothetical protein